MPNIDNDLDSFEPVARIVVIGIGGAGNNAVNRMIDDNIQNVEFYVANTDKQALASSKAPNRIILGDGSMRGLGAGGDPTVGRKAAEASQEELKKIFKGANMVFIAAGMGKGTGTGASPVVARLAKEAGALTMAIVTRPFSFEGSKRAQNAIRGLMELKDCVDSLIIVSNDKLLTQNGTDSVENAFIEGDKILAQSVKTVADVILVPGMINLDFEDVKTTLQNSGISLIGYGQGRGENKAEEAAMSAINSPLLEADIRGARRCICSVICGSNVTIYEAERCIKKITDELGIKDDIKFGLSINRNLDDCLIVSVIASDFENGEEIITPKQTIPAYQEKNEDVFSVPEENDDHSWDDDIDLSSELAPDFGDDHR